MIVVKKKMKKPLIIAILAAALAVLITAGIIISALISAKDGDESDSGSSEKIPEIIPEIGEIIYGQSALVYAPVNQKDIQFLEIKTTSVDNGGNTYKYGYTFVKDTSDSNSENQHFILSYTDKDGNDYTYYPEIITEDSTVKYSDLYAFEQNDGFGTIPKLYYLLEGIGTVRFSSRVAVESDAAEREIQLKSYGLSKTDGAVEINFSYVDSNEKINNIVLQIGSKLVSGSGYYMRVGSIKSDENGDSYVEYRPYVYTTQATTYIDYAFLDFSDFINPILVAKGLPQDNAFEPYLTTDFKQWKNTLYLPYVDKDTNETVNYVISEKANSIVLHTAIKTPDMKNGGYNVDEKSVEFDLQKMKNDAEYKRLFNALVGQSTGKTSITVTTPEYNRQVNLDDTISDGYSYEILSIDAILTDSGDVTDRAVTANDKVKVSYKLNIGGDEYASGGTLYGIIDLASDKTPDAADALIGRECGGIDGGLDISVDYDKTNTVTRKVQMLITEIIQIRSTEDRTESVETVQSGTTVAVRYYIVIDGVISDDYEEFYIEITDEMSDDSAEIANAIMGKKEGKNYEITVDSYSMSCEFIAGFSTYEISEIKYFTEREEIVSFCFTQASERDEYYGGSIYTNTMQNPEYKMYALNPPSCETVVAILGGLLENASTSEGLTGIRTVDVVLTPEKMLKYGLYANTVYFELPRGITEKPGNYEFDELVDYNYLNKLGFTLYISDADPITGTRYIGSDIYDIVAEVEASAFTFLDKDFLTFYANRNIVLASVTDIENIKLEFFMDQLHGTYNNDLQHTELYKYAGKLYSAEQLDKMLENELVTEEQLAEAEKITISKILASFTNSGDCRADACDCKEIETLFHKYLKENGKDSVYFDALYGGALVEGEAEFIGTNYFKEFLLTLFTTSYENLIADSEEMIDELVKNHVISDNKLMRMTVDLGEDYRYGYNYVYEFYKIPGTSRIIVKMYKEMDGRIIEGSDTANFYISDTAFKKVVSKYIQLLNAQHVENDDPYFGNLG